MIEKKVIDCLIEYAIYGDEGPYLYYQRKYGRLN